MLVSLFPVKSEEEEAATPPCHVPVPPRPLRSKQADRWWCFPGTLKPVVEEAISYHGDWLEGEGVGGWVLAQCFVKSVANGLW